VNVSYTVTGFQMRGDPGPLEPREPRLNPDGTLEFGVGGGETIRFYPATESGLTAQQLDTWLAQFIRRSDFPDLLSMYTLSKM
jgi:hypothetical protein